MINQPTTDFSTLPPIMAVDFDGTLVEDNFPEIGKEIEHICEFVRRMQILGVKTILWTSRTGDALKAAIEWCEDNNLQFTTINENIPEVIELTGGIDTRKVYADVYLDDRNRCIDNYMSGAKSNVKRIMEWLGR